MRLGLAVISAAAVIGGYTLVNTLHSRAVSSAPESSAGEGLRSWMPRAIEEPADEPRSFELIRYLNPDGSVGMVDDPRRVPQGAKILSRERKTVAAAKPAPGPDPAVRSREGGRRPLSPAEQRVMERVLETGVFPDASQLEQMQGDLDAVDRERGGARGR